MSSLPISVRHGLGATNEPPPQSLPLLKTAKALLETAKALLETAKD